jgi:hypothetical protein
MNLTDSQKETIAAWVAEGLKLSDVQSRIQEEFEISLTYMDVRFLLDDLNLELKDQPKPVDNDLRNAPPPEQPEGQASDATPSAGGVSVTLHKLYKPGAVVSGEVVFSDGETSEWTLDQAGRLALNPGTEAYQPSEADLQDFQKKLSELLQGQGF